jgi:zinc transporter
MQEFRHIEDYMQCWQMHGNGSGRQFNPRDVSMLEPHPDSWTWLHLDYSKPQVRQWMNAHSGIPTLTVEALVQDETRPRCVEIGDGLVIFLRGVNLNPEADPEDMVSVRIWVDRKRVISLSKRHVYSLDAMVTAIRENQGPETPGDFVAMLIDFLLDRASNVINDLLDQVDELDDLSISSLNIGQRELLGNLRGQAISLRRFLAPQREALNRLTIEKTALLSDKNRLHLREHADRLTRLVEDLDAARERAVVIHEMLVTRFAEQTNQRMYVLSIIAAIFLPLSFITGLLGINVGGIPGAENSYGFVSVVILLSVIFLLLWLFFKKRRWF